MARTLDQILADEKPEVVDEANKAASEMLKWIEQGQRDERFDENVANENSANADS